MINLRIWFHCITTLLAVMGLASCGAPDHSEDQQADKGVDWNMQRQSMVEQQIAARGIKNPRVLDALRKVERQFFVPPEERDHAYEDRPLPIGERQTISQPYIVGLMTELLEVGPGDKVLEVGTGSGYQTAVLAEIVAEVYTVEIVDNLGLRAKLLLDELGYENVRVSIGDGYLGWPEAAPFDAIIVTAAPPRVPESLVEQLKPGGRMVIPVGPDLDKQELLIVEKTDEGITTHPSIPVRFVPMTGLAMDKDEE